MLDYIHHSDRCVRFGMSDDCQACKFIERKIEKIKTKEKLRYRYRHAILGRKF